jgi:hypothetical protein
MASVQGTTIMTLGGVISVHKARVLGILRPPRGNPACIHCASEMSSLHIRPKHDRMELSKAVAKGATVSGGVTRVRYVIFALPRQARSSNSSTYGSSISVSSRWACLDTFTTASRAPALWD